MSILRRGPSKSYSRNWASAFGKKIATKKSPKKSKASKKAVKAKKASKKN